MLASLCLVLPVCAGLTKSDRYILRQPALTAPDSALVHRCVGPVSLGDKGLTQAEVERLWRTDRQRLLTCIRRHLALVEFYADRDGALAAGDAK